MSPLKNPFRSRPDEYKKTADLHSNETLADSNAESRYYDLNAGNENLTHWKLEHALRELIANALDEQRETETKPIEVFWDEAGKLHIRDYGRGLEESHLVIGGAKRKEKDPNAIGHFDAGLKDALSVFYRDKIKVEFRSKHLYSKKLAWKTKAENTKTIHVELKPVPDSLFVGTEFILEGISIESLDRAKSLFLFFQDRNPIEIVQDKSGGVIGEIYETLSGESHLYVNGQQMSAAKNSLFSYNLLNVSEKVKAMPGRDREVRTFSTYKDQIVKLLRNATSATVIDALIEDLAKLSDQRSDEHSWTEVRSITSERLHSKGANLVYVTEKELEELSAADKEIVAERGSRFQLMAQSEIDSLLKKFPEAETLESVRSDYKKGFEFEWIELEELSEDELLNFTLAVENAKRILSEGGLKHNFTIRVSEKLMTTPFGGDTLGLWCSSQSEIVIKRSVLLDLKETYITIFHELAHAQHSYSDNTRDFEDDLGETIGLLAMALFSNSSTGDAFNDQ